MAVELTDAGVNTLARPAYAVGAVDHALVTLELLVQRPTVRLTDLAAELGVGRATAHRLLRMMVYRGFAVQNADRSYAAGPALSRSKGPDEAHNLPLLQARFRPYLEEVGSTLGETVHLKVLVGIEAVCLDSVEGSRPLHTDGARGVRFPAEHVSGGLALLAGLPRSDLHRRYAGRPEASMAKLEETLLITRRRGFGLVLGEGRAGVTSVAALVLGSTGRPVAAVSCAAPAMRLGRAQTIFVAELLVATAESARLDGSVTNGPANPLNSNGTRS